MNITEPIRRAARDRPESIAMIRRDGTTTSYRELDRAIDHAARGLAAAGVRRGDVVLVAIADHDRVVVVQAALARMGAAAATPTLAARYAAACLVDVPPSSMLHPRTIAVDERWFDRGAIAASAPFPIDAGDDEIAIVIQSSGTTGEHKNIALSHRMFDARHAAQAQRLPLPDELRVICVRRPSSSYGFSVRMRTLRHGGTVVEAAEPSDVLAMIERHRVTRLVAPPYTLDRMTALRPAHAGPLASLRQIEVGGSFLPGALYALTSERLCASIYNNYGVTEAGFIAGGLMSTLDREAGEVGRIVDGVDYEVAGRDGRALPPGETGILRVRTVQAAHGYIDAPDATRDTFRDGWVDTGDRCRVSRDGMLTLAGRESDHIDIGGYKVSPLAIEQALLSLDAVVDAAAFGVRGPNGIAVLGAAVVTRGPIDRNALVAAMRQHSPRAAPQFVMGVGEIPRNEAGKVLRRELASRAEAMGAHRTTGDG